MAVKNPAVLFAPADAAIELLKAQRLLSG